jgi:hypothetical protein
VEPGRSLVAASSINQEFGPVTKSNNWESPSAAETTTSLLRALVDRIDRLEASLHGARKGVASDNILMNNTDYGLKPATTAGLSTASNQEHAYVEEEASSAQNSQAEAEEAATVLEFLAWGRVKDANFADTIKKPGEVQEPEPFPEKKTLYTMRPSNPSLPSASTAEYFCTRTAVVTHLQEMLPNQIQVLQLFEFHREWLLWIHCSFHAPTVAEALEDFYSNDCGVISLSSSKLQWTALLFAILSVTAASAKPECMMRWRFREGEHGFQAKLWYQAAIECMNAARYQENHNIFSLQAIGTMTMCAHTLGFSNTQSILIASAIRIAQSLGLHRLKGERGEYKPPTNDREREAHIQLEAGKRVWQQLLTQDWFSVPFSETYSVNPLHTTSNQPYNFDEKTLELVPYSCPSILSYANFVFESVFRFSICIHDEY